MTADVWLPIPPDEIEGLPEGPAYRHWDGEETFPADPADCAYYVVPYMKPGPVGLRPLPRMRNVQVLQTLSAGIDSVEPGLKQLPAGVRLCNARGVHEASTAELTLTLILASLRGVPDFVRAQDRGEWLGGFRPALADRTVLIVGYGSIGAAIEDRLVPFEVAPVVRVARSARATERGPVHPLTDLPALLPRADVVVLSTPLTEATRGLVDAEFLARMKDGALLVNVARGPVVDTKALLTELENGRLTAALDVTDPEPLPTDHPLWHAPGIVVSPHAGGPTSAFLPRAKRLLVDQLNRFVNQEPLRNVILTTGA
ncbi:MULTISPECIES: 2-hydroxyacid dehydrogenase [Streptomyces]|jgi:phosphoglycerate dehydrogenase-like enzyme|uniref:2-hydroxyacid dehydrogenase n=1 Tax=Streptomyces olivaceus TaxID=47716 RepID=A0ABS7WAH1_STROV|nr:MULTISPECIES: 2-hydroxyacid dehydrogenase [Streptomyces]MBZ6083754.1 2-hydroxyacid dehydrogenase [Streptomyces olivaceus]MBZ6092117.1 2-hydroxyacid dehydrogenase [Streptomyces olivaceus]MBZ6098986.1 2-hydroxyacid dehydrogenase [Streptomyces olivaceus]MBZ6107801.1 2-hydroxyacid dehydrogenase [Streptomyces olivaceus]MBZ6112844.1 2-hydroxyacid dehydrogenase [Streptomyces olivaceus]